MSNRDGSVFLIESDANRPGKRRGRKFVRMTESARMSVASFVEVNLQRHQTLFVVVQVVAIQGSWIRHREKNDHTNDLQLSGGIDSRPTAQRLFARPGGNQSGRNQRRRDICRDDHSVKPGHLVHSSIVAKVNNRALPVPCRPAGFPKIVGRRRLGRRSRV